MITIEESNRVPLGIITLGVTQASNPPSSSSGPGVLENVYEFTIPLSSTLAGAELRRMRFNKIEIVANIPDTCDDAVVMIRHSRVSPAPTSYAPYTEVAADRWCSKGGQQIFRLPNLAGGDTITTEVNGARWINCYLGSQTGTGTIVLTLYGILGQKVV